jgi:hypothetical protein
MKNNKEWVKKQFKTFNDNITKGYRLYRDTLLITSFIEAVIKETASRTKKTKYKKFIPALEALGLIFDDKKNDESITHLKENCEYLEGCLIEINHIRVYRNELLHDIINKDLSVDSINSKIHEMSKKIEYICNNSNLFRDYFINNYDFDPKEII